MPFTRSCAIYLLSLSLWRKTLFEKRHRDPETSNCVIAYNRKYKAVKIDRLASIFYLCEYNRSELRFSPRERWRRVLTLDRMRQKKKRKKERKMKQNKTSGISSFFSRPRGAHGCFVIWSNAFFLPVPHVAINLNSCVKLPRRETDASPPLAEEIY